MDWTTFFKYFMIFWLVSFPLTAVIFYFAITEFLDLALNTNKINKLLNYSDTLNTTLLEQQYQIEKRRQSSLTKSTLMELERQINYVRLTEKESNNIWGSKVTYEVKEKITAAKKVADIFKPK